MIQPAVDALYHGNSIIFPTDTVYGIGCDATQDHAVEALFALTDRDPNKGMVILCDSMAMIEEYADIRFDLEKRLIDEYMPGPLTIILDSKHEVSELLEQKNGTLGVRIPDHDLVLELIAQLERPIATKSANRAGLSTPICVEDIDPYFRDHKIMIIDGGVTDVQIPSTIVRVLDEENVHILREGAVPSIEIYGWLAELGD